MNKYVHDFIDFAENHRQINTKDEIIGRATEKFNLIKDGRALFHNNFFAVVFCYTKNTSFSNVVLSLSKLEKYDRIPCFVIVVRRNIDNIIYLINSTFIDKISHSSQALTTNNIRGSFLGSNIRKNIDELGMQNIPVHFDALFSYHQGFSWNDNLERLVESTNNIKPFARKAVFSDNELDNIFSSPQRAIEFVQSTDFDCLLGDLRKRCDDAKDAILAASHINNVNIRGRLIEVLITSDQSKRNELLNDIQNIESLLPTYDTANEIGDYVRTFDASETYTDIKTKVVYLDSNPKAYNIDKFLKCMSRDNSVFMFFFIGIDTSGIVNTILCSVYHKE